MEGKQKLEMKILLDKPSFYIDEIITGNLIFQTERSAIIEKIVIEIKFFQKFNKAINTKNASVICFEKLCCFDLDLNPFLSKVEGCYILRGGNTKIPFKIDLKRDLYPCFEFPLKDKYAFLRYEMLVNVFSMSFYKNNFRHYIRLLSRPFINDKNKHLSKSISKNLKKWNIINIGTTKLTVSIPDNNCKYDDTNFKVIVFIDNLLGKASTKEIKVKLMRTIELYNHNNQIDFKEELPVSSRDIPAIVQPGGSNYFEVILPLREYDTSRYVYNINNPIPYDFFLSDINFYMPTIFSRCITCKYELIVSLNFNCLVYESSLPKITFPIYMTNQSPFEYQLDIQKKEYEKKNKFYTNDVNENIGNNINKINNLKNISENNKQFANNNSGGSINIFDAPNPFNQYKNIDIDVNIFEQNNNNINKNKVFMNDNENMNINVGNNNIKYNFNISINNNMEGNLNNNINNNIINNNLNNNNNIIENDNNIFENENKNNNEIKKKSIKESTFNLL